MTKTLSEQLAGKALDNIVPYTWTKLDYEQIHEVLAYHQELVVLETTKLLQQEWYKLNNDETVEHDPRLLGIKLGLKHGMLNAISRIKLHFGIES